MKISELARETGTTVATLKYYLREGLMPAGATVSATSATYDDTHLARVRLIRALVESAGLSIAQVHRVVHAVDNPPSSWHDLLGSAQRALSPAAQRDRVRTPQADRLVRSQGWRVSTGSPVRVDLERALDCARAAGVAPDGEALDAYAEAARGIADIDLASVPTDSPEDAVRHVVVGTVLLDPVLSALRRLAQEDASARRFTRTRAPVRTATPQR